MINKIFNNEETDFLWNHWYVVASSKEVKPGKTLHRTILGKPVLIGRKFNGELFSLKDTCPHRGTLLSAGYFNGEEVECPYHGWRFKTDGQCTFIPSQLPGQTPQAIDIKTKNYPIAEEGGIVWLFLGKQNKNIPTIPQIAITSEIPKLYINKAFECGIDLAITGLMDPAHGAFVHASSLWRKNRDVRKKEKKIIPFKTGWQIESHPSSSNSKAYRLFLGSKPETQISYMLPGVRIEITKTNKYQYSGITACTPENSEKTIVHHFMYWNVPGGPILKKIVEIIAYNFINQDAKATLWMRDGKSFDKKEILVEDADTQIRWYYRLKKEWQLSQYENRPFRNPIKAKTLYWKS